MSSDTIPQVPQIDFPTTDNPAGDIFGNAASAEFIDQIEAGNVGSTGTVSFSGSIDPNRDLNYVDPKSMIEVFVRPHRQFSHVVDPAVLRGIKKDQFTIEQIGPDFRACYLPDMPYRVARSTYEANRAVLCTRGEYVKIKAQEKTPEHRNVQRQILEMREHQSQTSRAAMTDQQKDRELELRNAATVHAKSVEIAEQKKREVVKEVETREHAEKKAEMDRRLAAMDQAAFEDYLADLRAQSAPVIARTGERARRILEEELNHEEETLRTRYGQLQLARAATRPTSAPSQDEPCADPAAKIEKLRAFLAAGTLTQDEFDRQVARLIS